MNTPAHLLLNLSALTSGKGRAHTHPVLVGALLPDLPMWVFYAWQRIIVGLPETQIWREAYFRVPWQNFFDLFNSIPLAAAGLLIALRARRRTVVYLFASVLLHCLFDFFVHREDGHRHFFPFSDWRFISPVSYWDPRYHGATGAAVELAVVIGSALVLWPRFKGRTTRILLVGTCALYAAGYALLYGGLAPDSFNGLGGAG